MPIAFDCPSCTKRYSLPETYAGKRVRCKACQKPMSIPARTEPELAEEDGFDFGALAGLEPAPIAVQPRGEATVHRAAPPRGRAAQPSQPTAPFVSRSPAGRLPPWVGEWAGRLDRFRPRSLWAWGVSVIALLLLGGFLWEGIAIGVITILCGIGAILLAAALVWGVVVGIAIGSRVLVGVVVGASALTLLIALNKLVRLSTSPPSAAGEQLPVAAIVITIAVALCLIAILAAMITNPRAFKRPFFLGSIGVLCLCLGPVPGIYHANAAATRRREMRDADPLGSREFGQVPSWASSPSKPMRPGGGSSVAVPSKYPGPSSRPPPSDRGEFALPHDKLVLEIGREVEVKRGGSWDVARIVSDERGWVLVEDVDSRNTREWVEPWRLRAVGSMVDDFRLVLPNGTWGVPQAPAPDGPPGPKPSR